MPVESNAGVRTKDLLLALMAGAVATVVIMLSWREMPELRLWRSVDVALVEGPPTATLFGIIHLLVGLSIFTPSIYFLIDITRVNQQAQAGKNKPLYLLKSGYYSLVRHPMNGMFMTTVFGFFYATSSLIGILLIAFLVGFLHLATLYEESKWLLPRFGKEYESYMDEVRRRYLPATPQVVLSVLFIVALVGSLV
jgi:protein-S-isoprenylcysteine O-methyltransferase Ste14